MSAANLRRFDDRPSRGTRSLQIWQILIGRANNRQTITYIMLADMLGFKGAHVLGTFLEPIMRHCQAAGLPSLTVIVVSQNTGLPGTGLEVHRDNLHSEQEKVFRFDWYGIYPPTPEEFDIAMKD